MEPHQHVIGQIHTPCRVDKAHIFHLWDRAKKRAKYERCYAGGTLVLCVFRRGWFTISILRRYHAYWHLGIDAQILGMGVTLRNREDNYDEERGIYIAVKRCFANFFGCPAHPGEREKG